MIVGVAVKFGDHIEVRLPAPNRHCHCFWYFAEVTGKTAGEIGLEANGEQQGFYTDKGVFLNRRKAFLHVRQIKQPTIGEPKKYLFSEDLW